jgi:hypothetical protein
MAGIRRSNLPHPLRNLGEHAYAPKKTKTKGAGVAAVMKSLSKLSKPKKGY